MRRLLALALLLAGLGLTQPGCCSCRHHHHQNDDDDDTKGKAALERTPADLPG